MHTKTVIGADDADRILAAAKAEAVKNGWKVSIAIMDEAGYLLRFDRADGAGLMTADVAMEKARSAAKGRMPTKALEEMAASRPGIASLKGYIFVQGGLPIMYEGVCVGGIGVSGVQSEDDERIAAAGLAAL